MATATTKTLLLDLAAVCAAVGLSQRTIYRLMARGQFPKPKIVPGVRGHRWTRASVERWAERLADNVDAGDDDRE